MLVIDDGPGAVFRAPLLRVDSIDDYGGAAYLLFDTQPQGSRLVVPFEGVRSCAPDDIDPLRTVLRYDNGVWTELKDMSPDARVRHWRRAASEALAMPPGPGRRFQTTLLAAMIDAEHANASDPLLADQLAQIILTLLADVTGEEGDGRGLPPDDYPGGDE
jgi:hypothetical protein